MIVCVRIRIIFLLLAGFGTLCSCLERVCIAAATSIHKLVAASLLLERSILFIYFRIVEGHCRWTHTESPPRKVCSATTCTGSRLKLAHRVINCKNLLLTIFLIH